MTNCYCCRAAAPRLLPRLSDERTRTSCCPSANHDRFLSVSGSGRKNSDEAAVAGQAQRRKNHLAVAGQAPYLRHPACET